MKWYLSYDVWNGLIDSIWRLMMGDGLIDAIWRLMMEDGIKYAIRRSVNCIRDSFARACIPVIEKDFTGEC